MNKILLFILLLVYGKCAFAQRSKHVVIISIDGFRPDMYLDSSWPAPNLRWLMKHGMYAKHLKSVFPSYTYPSHTAMVTGAFPARSKIWFNQPKGSKGEWNWFMDSVRVPMIWETLKKSGMITAAVQWPVSVGKFIDYNIPEYWELGNSEDRISAAKKYINPIGFFDELEKNVGKLDSNTMHEDKFCWDENSARMAAYIFVRYKPNLLAVHFASVDGMEHEFGRENDSVRLALASNDHAIGDVLAAIELAGLKDSTTVIIVGDHGFSDVHMAFRPNMLIKDVPAKFIASGGSAFLYAAPSGSPNGGGKEQNDNNSIIQEVIQKLNKLPADKRKLFRIIDRKELDVMGADSSAILALAAEPGMVFTGSLGAAKTTNNGPGTLIQQNPLDGVFVPSSGGHHGYDPSNQLMYTGFIAYGAGIKKGNVIEEIREVDIAPLIAKLLGIEFKVPDGKLVPGVLSN